MVKDFRVRMFEIFSIIIVCDREGKHAVSVRIAERLDKPPANIARLLDYYYDRGYLARYPTKKRSTWENGHRVKHGIIDGCWWAYELTQVGRDKLKAIKDELEERKVLRGEEVRL